MLNKSLCSSQQTYDVIMQIPKEYRTLEILNNLTIASKHTNDEDSFVPITDIISIESDIMAHKIEHLDLAREITISGNINSSDYSTVFNKINQLTSIYQLPNGINIIQGGDDEEIHEALQNITQTLIMGFIFIYLILVVLYRSVILPIITMISLPLSFIGTFMALYVSGNTFNLYSVIGIVMLMGLSAKNGILLVDSINYQIKQGFEINHAIIEAVNARFRPIMMTTMAIIFGMLPLILSNASGSEKLHPLAYSVIGGMISSTVLTLLILPIIYSYLAKLQVWKFKNVKNK